VNFEITISPKVKRNLDTQSDKTIERIGLAFRKLQKNPFYCESLDIKKLSGFRKDYRLRIGKLRILYTVVKNEKLIYVYKISIRGKAYK